MNKVSKTYERIWIHEENEARIWMETSAKSEELNLQNVLGFINQKKVNQVLNISNIMWLKKMKFSDLYAVKDMDMILLWDNILRRFMLIITSYFCLGTELRFLKQMKLQGFADSVES